MAIYEWQPFLARWSRELLASPYYREPSYYYQAPSPEAAATGWLGYPPANEADLAALEARLGVAVPPSYGEFLRVTNGWGKTTPFIDHLWSTEEVDWFAVRNQDWIDAWLEGWTAGGYAPDLVPDEEYRVYGADQVP